MRRFKSYYQRLEEIMKIHEVEVKVTEVYHVSVEAEDEHSAADIAFDIILSAEDTYKYHYDSDATCTVYKKVN